MNAKDERPLRGRDSLLHAIPSPHQDSRLLPSRATAASQTSSCLSCRKWSAWPSMGSRRSLSACGSFLPQVRSKKTLSTQAAAGTTTPSKANASSICDLSAVARKGSERSMKASAAGTAAPDSATERRTYGTMYGMVKTTVYLPDDLKLALARMARETGRSEADLIRDGIRLAVAQQQPPPPTIGILVSDDPSFAQRVDEHLDGFGRQ